MIAGTSSLPLVSIVTPSLNHGRFIEAAIESVRGQDYPRIEHIVVDGASRDDTLEILTRHTASVRWVSELDSGQTQAINRGLRMANGEIISWLNADDELLAGSVSAVVRAFDREPSAMMIYGDGYLTDIAGDRLGPFRSTEPFHLRRLIEVHNYILQPAAFVRREALEAIGYLDETFQLCMDWDLWIRIGQRFDVRYLPVALAAVRVHAETKTRRAGLSKIVETLRIVGRHSRRWVPPVLLIDIASVLHRKVRRTRGGTVPAWARRFVDRIVESGQLPWERKRDPSLQRPASARTERPGSKECRPGH